MKKYENEIHIVHKCFAEIIIIYEKIFEISLT